MATPRTLVHDHEGKSQPLPAAGGAGVPGGVDTNVQYNDAGAFGGDAGLCFFEVLNSVTIGAGCTATGNRALSQGNTNAVAGDNSRASGNGNIVGGDNSEASGDTNNVAGDNSVAEGSGNAVAGNQAHAEGTGNGATVNNAHVEGNGNTAAGLQSHVEGAFNVGNALDCHVEGRGNAVPVGAIASHVEGGFNIVGAAATDSHVEGNSNDCGAARGHAEGTGNIISPGANQAHVEGEDNTGNAENCHVEGKEALATRVCQYSKASGKFLVAGDAQMAAFTLKVSTAGAAPTVMSNDGATLLLEANKSYRYRGMVIARTAVGDTKEWEIRGVCKVAAGVVSNLAAPSVLNTWGDAGLALAVIGVGVSGAALPASLNVTVTGIAITNIRWFAYLEWVELLYV